VKRSLTLYGLLAIIGIVLLTLILVSSYLDGADALSILTLLSPMSPPNLGLWFVLGGIVLLTVGMVGIIRRYFKNHRNLFTALAILLIPPLTFATLVFGCTFAFFSAPMFPLRSEITQVTVVDNSPLVLSVGVKAITSSDSRIEGVIVLNGDDELVAKIPLDDRAWLEGSDLAVLPAGSEISLTLDFNTTLPAGKYLVRLTCWHQNHGSSLFTIS
jgi:hypothetical protein